MGKTAFFIALFSSAAAFAALPPLAQSTKELQAILTDARLQDSLGSGELIQDLIRTETGYLVMTQNYLLKVDIHYGKPARPGPIPFELDFHQPVNFKTGVPRTVKFCEFAGPS